MRHEIAEFMPSLNPFENFTKISLTRPIWCGTMEALLGIRPRLCMVSRVTAASAKDRETNPKSFFNSVGFGNRVLKIRVLSVLFALLP